VPADVRFDPREQILHADKLTTRAEA
jgi:hypothetical protein